MTDSRFHVLLPPKLLPLSAFKVGAPSPPGLIFYDLPNVPSGPLPSQSQPTRKGKQPRLPDPTPPEKTQRDEGAAPTASGEIADEVESWDDSEGKDRVPAKRPRGELEEPDSLYLLPSASAYRPQVDGLLSVQQLDGTESFMSLNTTVTNSQPSQPPLPNWTVPLSKLVSLHSLHSDRAPQRGVYQQGNGKISLMICVMVVDALQQLRRKEEKAMGREGTLWLGGWQVTAPPEGKARAETPGITVKFWDTMAKEWADGRVRRGDVVLLENVDYKPPTARDPATITVSSNSANPPKITILYRTLVRRAAGKADYLPPRALHDRAKLGQMLAPPPALSSRILAEDEALRPDLRLSRSDAGVRRVLEWAVWFANWVGGEPP